MGDLTQNNGSVMIRNHGEKVTYKKKTALTVAHISRAQQVIVLPEQIHLHEYAFTMSGKYLYI